MTLPLDFGAKTTSRAQPPLALSGSATPADSTSPAASTSRGAGGTSSALPTLVFTSPAAFKVNPDSPAAEKPPLSNLLARAIYRALLGDPSGGDASAVGNDLPLVLRLIEVATPDEVAAANVCLREEAKFDLATLGRVLEESARARLFQTLAQKGFRNLEGLSPVTNAQLAQQFVLAEFERARIFPRSDVQLGTREKLELLGEYLLNVVEGLEHYGNIFQKFEEAGLGERNPACPLWIVRSFRQGVWHDLAPTSARDVVSLAEPMIRRAAATISAWQSSLRGVTPAAMDELARDLEVANRFAIDFALDFCEEGGLLLAQTESRGWLERLVNAKPIQACESALERWFCRYLLVRRAAGVREFAAHMRESVKSLCAPPGLTPETVSE